MRNSKLWRGWLAALCVILGLLFKAVYDSGSHRRELARLLVPMPGTEGAAPVESSMWRSAARVVCALPPNYGSLIEVDVRTGKTRVLPPLPQFEGVPNQGTSVSPDGRWLLWPGGFNRWKVRAIDGGPIHEWKRPWPLPSDRLGAWLPDSSGWIELRSLPLPTGEVFQGRAILLNRQILRVYQVGSPRTRDIVLPIEPISNVERVLVTRTGEANVVGAYGGRWQVARVPLSRPAQTQVLTLWPSPAPGDSHVAQCLPSPHGDRIAWVFQKTHTIPYKEAIWISESDGSKARPILPEMKLDTASPTGLHWAHDGTRLCAWSDGRLVSIPIE